MTTALPAQAVAGLLRAISARLTPPRSPLYDTEYLLALRAANSDVRLAIAALLGKDLAPADVEAFTRLLAPEGAAPALPPYAEVPGIAHCAPGSCTCGGHVTADGVFHPAAVAL